MNDADRKVDALIMKIFREEFTDYPYTNGRYLDAAHLAACPTAVVEDPDARDVAYGCDTGCSVVKLDAVIKCACPDFGLYVFTWGEFRSLDTLLARMRETDDPEEV